MALTLGLDAALHHAVANNLGLGSGPMASASLVAARVIRSDATPWPLVVSPALTEAASFGRSNGLGFRAACCRAPDGFLCAIETASLLLLPVPSELPQLSSGPTRGFRSPGCWRKLVLAGLALAIGEGMGAVTPNDRSCGVVWMLGDSLDVTAARDRRWSCWPLCPMHQRNSARSHRHLGRPLSLTSDLARTPSPQRQGTARGLGWGALRTRSVKPRQPPLRSRFKPLAGTLDSTGAALASTAMRILLAEDDVRLAEPLVDFLEHDRHTVTWLSNGDQALTELLGGEYQLALLDWMLPSRDGLSIVRGLREQRNTTLVIMITARDALGDVVEGLQAGADDYVVKPFRMAELAARIRSLERRADRPYQPARLAWGPVELDPAAAAAWCHGRALTLTSKEWQLLEWFLRHPSRLFSRSQLLDQLWSLEADSGEDTVKTHLNNLRRKLRAAGSPDLIETVHGLGYRLMSPPA